MIYLLFVLFYKKKPDQLNRPNTICSSPVLLIRFIKTYQESDEVQLVYLKIYAYEKEKQERILAIIEKDNTCKNKILHK